MNLERAERWYRRLLRILPVSFRKEAETELVEVFRDAYARPGSRVRLWLRFTADVLVTATAERVSQGQTSRAAPDSGRWQAGSLDVRLALRRLSREPMHTLRSALALGIGLAAATLVITLVRSVLLSPLPFHEPAGLVRLLELDSTGGRWYPSFPNIRDWRELSGPVLSSVVAADMPQTRSVLFGNGAVRASVGGVSRDFFTTLGVRPVAGRLFTPGENARGGEPVALISPRFWQNQLGGRPLDRIHLTIGAETFAVVGVLPAYFRFLGMPGAWTDADVWLPMERKEMGGRQSHGYHTVARLRPGVALEAARAEMNRLSIEMKQRHGEGTQADQVRMTPLVDEVVGKARTPLQLLTIASLIVLLVTAFNLAAAVLARGLGRTRELAVRISLGAGRRDLVRYLLLETAALAAPGAALGIALAAAGLRALHGLRLPVPRLDEAQLNPSLMAMAVLLALLVTLLAGLAPALMLSAGSLATRLRTHGASATTRQDRSLWSGFIALQVALTLVLLTGTGQLLRSLREIVNQDLGYDSRLIAVDVTLPETRYADEARRVAYYTEALTRLRQHPGIAAAGITSVLPDETTSYTAGTRAVRDPQKYVYSGFRVVDPGYFAAVGLRQTSGDALGTTAHRTRVVIDDQLRRQLWEQNSPVGERVWNSFLRDTLAVLGTVSSLREWNQQDPIGVVYADYRAHPAFLLDMHFVVRPVSNRVMLAVQTVLREVDPQVPVTIEPLEQRIAGTFGERRLVLLIASSFAVVTLLLTALGVYAVVAYAVGRELKSVAIRLLLGARPASVVRIIVSYGVRPVLLGLVLGLIAAVPAVLVLRSQLFGVQPFDPLAALSGAAVLAAVALLAAWLPARSVLRVDPNVVLRTE